MKWASIATYKNHQMRKPARSDPSPARRPPQSDAAGKLGTAIVVQSIGASNVTSVLAKISETSSCSMRLWTVSSARLSSWSLPHCGMWLTSNGWNVSSRSVIGGLSYLLHAPSITKEAFLERTGGRLNAMSFMKCERFEPVHFMSSMTPDATNTTTQCNVRIFKKGLRTNNRESLGTPGSTHRLLKPHQRVHSRTRNPLDVVISA